MEPENSISIINRGNGTVLGETAQALPIMIKTSLSWLKIFLAGVFLSFLLFLTLLFTANTQVQTVEIVDKASNFQVLELK